MSYQVHNFIPHTHLPAASLNEMDEQIASSANDIDAIAHVDLRETVNIFDKSKALYGKRFLFDGSGVFQGETDSDSYIAYVDVKKSGNYVALNNWAMYGAKANVVLLFDNTHTWVKSVIGTLDSANKYVTHFSLSEDDVNAGYCIGYVIATNRIDVAMIVQSDTYPAEYQAYVRSDVTIKADVPAHRVVGLDDTVRELVNNAEIRKNIAFTKGFTYKYADGSVVVDSTYYGTELIPAIYDSYEFHNAQCGNSYLGVAYFDSQKRYLGGIRNITADITVLKNDTPTGTAYIAFGSKLAAAYVVASVSLTNELDRLENAVNSGVNKRYRMKFGAHNGNEYEAPEASVASFRLACEQGWDWMWIAGIHFSADGTLYCMHDTTVDRTTNGTGSITTLTDAQINALKIDLAGSGYNISAFSDEELRVPTFESVVEMCAVHDVKMCIRFDTFPTNLSTEDAVLKWQNAKGILDAYNVNYSDVAFYVNTKGRANTARQVFGADANVTIYLGANATPDDGIDWFATNEITGNRSFIIHHTMCTPESVKYLHSNGINVYAYGVTTQEQVNALAMMGVDICQNARFYSVK